MDSEELPIRKKRTPPRGKETVRASKKKSPYGNGNHFHTVVLIQYHLADDEDNEEFPIRKKKTLPHSKKTGSPMKKQTRSPPIVINGNDNDEDEEEEEEKLLSPLTPPRPVVKRTGKLVTKRASPVRKSPRAHKKPTQNEILAEKMKIGASIIPGAVTVKPVSNIH